MDENQFIAEIEAQTGKKIAEDYGFIMGTQCPFVPSKGMMVSSNRMGYAVWKKGGEEKEFTAKANIKQNLKEIIEFLK